MYKLLLLPLITMISYTASASDPRDLAEFYEENKVTRTVNSDGSVTVETEYFEADYPGQPKYTQAEDQALSAICDALGEPPADYQSQASQMITAILAMDDKELSQQIVNKIILDKETLVKLLKTPHSPVDKDEYSLEEEEYFLKKAKQAKK